MTANYSYPAICNAWHILYFNNTPKGLAPGSGQACPGVTASASCVKSWSGVPVFLVFPGSSDCINSGDLTHLVSQPDEFHRTQVFTPSPPKKKKTKERPGSIQYPRPFKNSLKSEPPQFPQMFHSAGVFIFAETKSLTVDTFFLPVALLLCPDEMGCQRDYYRHCVK